MTAPPDLPRAPDPDVMPSWAMPIAIGSTISFFGTVLLTVSAGFAPACALTSCGCLAPLSFVPFGYAVGLIAWRRDPRLSAGQTFNLCFIAIGLGMLLWAGVTVMQGGYSSIAEEMREQMARELEKAGDLEMTDEERERWSEIAGQFALYMPLAFAFYVSVLGAFCGMITVSILQRRQRRGAPPEPISEDPDAPPGP